MHRLKTTAVSLLAVTLGFGFAQTKLTIWTSLEGPELDWINKVGQTFPQTAGGKDTTVEVVFVPSNEVISKLVQGAPTGQGPDVIALVPHDRIGALATAGVLEPVGKYLSRTKKADTPESAFDALTYNGTLLGFPAFGEAVAVVYNKDLLPAGIPRNWKSFISTSQKLTNPGSQQFGFLANIAQPYNVFGFYSAMGGYVFGKDGNGALNPKDNGLDNAGAIKGVQLVNDMRYKYKLIPNGAEDPAVQKDLFLKGKVAMWMTGPWDIGDIKRANINYGIGLPPKPTGAVRDFSPFVGIQGVLVNAYSRNKKTAANLAQYVANSDNQLLMNQMGGRIPVSKRASAKLRTNAMVKGFGAAIRTGIPMPNIPEMTNVWDPWNAGVTLVTKSPNANVEEILKKAVSQMKSK